MWDGPEARSTDRLTDSEVLDAIDFAEAHRYTPTQRSRFRPVGLPHVVFMSVDPGQRLIWQGQNQLRIEGNASHVTYAASYHLITLDGHTLRIQLRGGEGPLAVAYRIRAALPPGYAATVKAGRPANEFADVFFWWS